MTLPKSFISRIESLLVDEATTFFDALLKKPAVSIRVNPKKGKDLFSEEEPVPWCKYGKYLKERPSFVFDPLYHAGAYYAQEASSMLFANAIDFSKDLKVLDLCAAPGGKSSLLLSMMTEGSLLVSNELVGKRNFILQENLIKWGYPNLLISQNRAEDFSPLEGFFDVVLVDAPCSGEGMFRKDEEAVAQWSEGLVNQCAAIQDEILESAIKLVAPGGILVYSTCTFEARENEDHLKRLYEEKGSMLEPVDLPIKPEWGMKEIQVPTGNGIQKGYYCFPHRVKGEGLFVSAFRVMENRMVNVGKNQKHTIRKANAAEIDCIRPFVELNENFSTWIKEDEVILLPVEHEMNMLFCISKILIRKSGIIAGVLQRNVFIPDHHLAMSGMASKQIPRIEVAERQALEFQQRQTMLPQENLPKGWFIYTYKGLDLGWAKNLGNRINNHYPAEWRIRKALEKEL